MKYFKIQKKLYTTQLQKAGKYVTQPIYTQYDVYDTESNVIFFRFQELHKKYLTDKNIQCTPEWEPYKELLPEIFITLQEDFIYNYNIILGPIREIKLNQILN